MVPGNSVQMQSATNVNNTTPAPSQSTGMSSETGEEEPLYVNAKQYNRILKRRAARAKLEAEGRIPRERKVSERFPDQIRFNIDFCLEKIPSRISSSSCNESCSGCWWSFCSWIETKSVEMNESFCFSSVI